MDSTIFISDNIEISHKAIFESSNSTINIVTEPYLNLVFIYTRNGERLQDATNESRHRFVDCSPLLLLEFIEENEPIPLDTLIDPQDAELQREMVSDVITLLVTECDGVFGLKMLQVEIMVEINTEETDYDLMELEDEGFFCERRMSLMLQKTIYMAGVTEEKKNCAICLDELKVGEEIVSTPCIHLFHNACIDKWFKRADFCPLCRFKIESF